MSSLPEPAPRAPDPRAELLDLLTRFTSLLALQVAHCDLHPSAYENPSGRLLRDHSQRETQRLLARKPAGL